MKLEHFALNVQHPLEVARWYVENMGMTIVKATDTEPYMHFIADSSGDVMMEVYCNPPDQVPDYGSMNPLLLHLAFVSDDPASDSVRLQNAGATLVDEKQLADGSHLIMMRDPWGLALQLCKRGNPMLRNKR